MPLFERVYAQRSKSRGEHVKFPLNNGGPPSKVKESILSIENKYCEGKSEKEPLSGVK